VTDFNVDGATAVNPIKTGASIPFGGITVMCKRQKDSSGTELYSEATVVLNTTKGTATEIVPAIIQPVPQTPAFQVKVFSSKGQMGDLPEASVSVDQGYKIVGGGARDNYSQPGNLLTASYPASPQTWTAKGKAHQEHSPATIDVFALGLHDPNDEWDVVIVPIDSGEPSNLLEAVATVPSGYVMTGGGAFCRYQGDGNMSTASYPLDSQSWHAKSKANRGSAP
jgi:hypothetical protein